MSGFDKRIGRLSLTVDERMGATLRRHYSTEEPSSWHLSLDELRDLQYLISRALGEDTVRTQRGMDSPVWPDTYRFRHLGG